MHLRNLNVVGRENNHMTSSRDSTSYQNMKATNPLKLTTHFTSMRELRVKCETNFMRISVDDKSHT